MNQTKILTLNRIFFIYGLTVSAILALKGFGSISKPADIFPFLLFLPVLFYFLIEIGKRFYLQFFRFLNADYLSLPEKKQFFFSPIAFLDQSQPLFLFTLFGFALALSLALIRLSINLVK